MNAPDLDRRLLAPWMRQGQLFVPPTIPQRHGEMDNIKPYVKYSELYGRVPTKQEFDVRLCGIGLRSLMVSLSSLMQIIYNDGVVTPTLQRQLAIRTLTPDALTRLMRLPNANERILFFPQQILYTMKCAALHSPDQADDRHDDAFRDELIQLLLMASEFLDDLQISGDSAETRRTLLSHIVRNFLLNATDQFRYMLPRAAVLYADLAGDRELRADPDFIDVAAVFQEATGFTISDFIAFGLALFPWFIDQSELRGTFDQARRSINPNTYFRNAHLDSDTARRLLTNLSHTHASLHAELRRRLEHTSAASRDSYDFLPLMRRPLYRVADDIVVPFHLGYLAARFSGGIYWTIFDHLAGDDRLRFSRFFGRVFEVYVRRAIQRAIPDYGILARRVYGDFEYRVSGQGDRRTSDVIVVYDRAAIFMEATASRIKMEDTAIAGDLNAFEDDTDKILLTKARQLTDRIRDFRNGLYSVGELTSRELPRIFPVIVTFGSMPESSITWAYFNERLRAQDLLQDERIEPLQILDVEEIEILEGLVPQGISLLDILERRMADPERRYISMKNYLIASLGERGVNEYMQGRYHELGAHVLDRLFGSQ